MSRSPWPWVKKTLCCWPCTTLISPFVRSCSASDVTRCTRPSYSSTIVPSAVLLQPLGERRPLLRIDVVDLHCLVWYWYSSSRSRKRSKSSVRAKTVALTGFVRPCSTFLVWSESVYWLRGGQVPALVVAAEPGS